MQQKKIQLIECVWNCCEETLQWNNSLFVIANYKSRFVIQSYRNVTNEDVIKDYVIFDYKYL